MADGTELVSYLNGQMMPHSQAVAAMAAVGSQSVDGFYDTERTFNGHLFKLRQHLERLYRGLDNSPIDPGLRLEEVEAATLEVLEANRPMLGPGDEFTITQAVSRGPASPEAGIPGANVVIYCQSLDFSGFARSYVDGARVITPATYTVPARSASGGKQGGLEPIMLMANREGNITECTGANFMFVRERRIKLPDRRYVLPGVSMQTALELAESLGIAVDEDDYCTCDVYEADEAFVSSTRYCMLPVATINGLSIGDELPSPLTRKLLDAWQQMVGVEFVKQALDHLGPEGLDAPGEEI